MGIYVLYILVGLLIGSVSGSLGIGGGVLLVPIFMLFFQYDQSEASGTSLAILMLPVLMPAAWTYFYRNQVNIHAAICVALSLAIGSYLGGRLQPSIPKTELRIAFGLVLMFIGARYVFGSEKTVASASMGLIVVIASWIAYMGVFMLGRRHQPRALGPEIQRYAERQTDEPEYYI